MQLPKWMRRAIKDQALSEQEAAEIHSICMASEQEAVQMPEHLWDAVERLQLWEAPVETMVQ